MNFLRNIQPFTWLFPKSSRNLYARNLFLSSGQLTSKNAEPRQPYYFVTTPIFYVNAAPHIGHVYSAVLADASARFRRLLGHHPVVFSTGTDEHGLKIQQAAEAAGDNCLGHCDKVSALFRQALAECEISHTDFIRTTETRHKNVVQDVWKTLEKNGHIYTGEYQGWYCIADEMFVSEPQTEVRTVNGKQQRVSVDSGRPVEWSQETNYLFKLSNFRDDLKHWFNSENAVRPANYRSTLKCWLDEELEDLSISRPSSRLRWGIPVPGDPSQTIYVWLDALFNYYTVAKQLEDLDTNLSQNVWPPSVHVIGKDILKFHGIYWPAFLMAAGLDPPSSLLVHGHWTVEGEKMSKTLGNVVDPFQCVKDVSVSGLRYFLLHEGVPAYDGNFSYTRMVRLLNAELADSLGNLMQRCSGLSLNPSQTVPLVNRTSFQLCGQLGNDLLKALEELPDTVREKYSDWTFYKGIDSIMAVIRAANLMVQTTQPWVLKKQGKTVELEAVLGVSLETLRIAGILLQPIVPSLATTLLDKLGVNKNERSWNFAELRMDEYPRKFGMSSGVLFTKIKS